MVEVYSRLGEWSRAHRVKGSLNSMNTCEGAHLAGDYEVGLTTAKRAFRVEEYRGIRQ